MTTRRRRTLLQEIGRLVAAHSTSEWETLVDALNDEVRRGEMLNALKACAELSKTIKKRPPASVHRQSKVDRVLVEVTRADQKKGEVLQSLYAELRGQKLFRSMANLRKFAVSCGLKDEIPGRREQVISALILRLSEKPQLEIENLIRRLLVAERDFGKEYKRWANIIMKE